MSENCPKCGKPTFDNDGYPTEAFLEEIETAKLNSRADCKKLAEIVVNAWHVCGSAKIEDGLLVLVTGGWSGNESLQYALHANFMFAALCWESSHRGGLYIYRVEEAAKAEE